MEGITGRKAGVCDLQHFALGMPCCKTVMTVA